MIAEQEKDGTINPYFFRTEDYEVAGPTSYEAASARPQGMEYVVVNRKTRVVEWTGNKLPEVISAAYALQRGLNLIREGVLEREFSDSTPVAAPSGYSVFPADAFGNKLS